MTSNIEVAAKLIDANRPTYSLAEAYYEGTVGEVFSSARLARVLVGNEDYRLNFCRTVVDAVNNRLELAAILGSNDQSRKAINSIWEQNDLTLEVNEIHRGALEYGDCYVIVWPDAEGEVEISYNSPKNAVIVYDAENPRRKSFGAKVWTVMTGTGEATRANLYYADRIEKYGHDGTETLGATWTLLEVVENPFGQVPMFHFRTERPYGRPEHLDAYGPQDMITKLVSMHMSVIDYQGAPQRFALSQFSNDAELEDFEENDTDRENVGRLKNGPGELWYLKGVSAVGQFDPADHKTFTEPLKDYVRSMASLTSTPLHYFEKTGNVPSGEALRVAEAPLMKKVADRQVAFGSAWRDVFRFALSIMGIKADVEVKWAAVESIDTLDAWEVAIRKRTAGVSLRQVLTEMGYDVEVIEMILAESKDGFDAVGMNAHNVALQTQKRNREEETE